jgi:hypothetical protein
MILPIAAREKGGPTKEPRQFEKSVESRGGIHASPPRQPERGRRFWIVKLEQRIAPGHGHGNNGSDPTCGRACGTFG